MVGCFQRKSTDLMMPVEPTNRIGLFHRKSTNDYVVLWQGRQIATYPSIEAFVDAHLEGLIALEQNQNDLLETLYRAP